MTDELAPPPSEPPPDQPAEAARPKGDRDLGLSWGLVVFVLASLFIVIFIVQNSDAALVKFLNWEGQFPLSLIMVVIALLAVIADEVVGVMRRRRRRRQIAEREELERFRRT
jgi:uncharacterized integral membrane protein